LGFFFATATELVFSGFALIINELLKWYSIDCLNKPFCPLNCMQIRKMVVLNAEAKSIFGLEYLDILFFICRSDDINLKLSQLNASSPQAVTVLCTENNNFNV
jgi:hypothetical protein